MTLWILDTDHTSLLETVSLTEETSATNCFAFLAGNKSVITQVAEHSDHIAITIITVQELFNGWNGKLNDPRQANKLSNIYTKLWQTTEFFKIITILNFDRDAEACYNNLRQSNRNLVKRKLEKDLRIASIDLMQNAIVVTRNYKDFSQFPNLKLDNWALPLIWGKM